MLNIRLCSFVMALVLLKSRWNSVFWFVHFFGVFLVSDGQTVKFLVTGERTRRWEKLEKSTTHFNLIWSTRKKKMYATFRSSTHPIHCAYSSSMRHRCVSRKTSFSINFQLLLTSLFIGLFSREQHLASIFDQRVRTRAEAQLASA